MRTCSTLASHWLKRFNKKCFVKTADPSWTVFGPKEGSYLQQGEINGLPDTSVHRPASISTSVLADSHKTVTSHPLLRRMPSSYSQADFFCWPLLFCIDTNLLFTPQPLPAVPTCVTRGGALAADMRTISGINIWVYDGLCGMPSYSQSSPCEETVFGVLYMVVYHFFSFPPK